MPDGGNWTYEQSAREEVAIFELCAVQAQGWIATNGTQSLVDLLREKRAQCLRMKLGTTNTLILLAHIDALEVALAEAKSDPGLQTPAVASDA